MTVSWFQVFLLYLTMRLTVFTVLVPDITSSPCPTRDVWMVPLIVVPATCLIGAIAIKLGSLFPGKTLIEYSRSLTGPVVGPFISLMYAWWFVGIAALNLRLSSEFFLTALFPETPISVFIGVIAFTSVYAARLGYQAVARANQILAPIMVLLVWTLFLLSFKDLDLGHLTPVLAGGLKPVLLSSLASLAFFSDIINLGMIIPYMNKPSEASKSLMWAIPIAGLHSMIITFTIIGLLGIDYAKDIAFPGLTLARRLEITGVIQRFEVSVLIIWLGGVFVRITLALIWASLAISQGFKLKKYESVVLPVTLLAAAMSMHMADNTIDLAAMMQGGKVAPYYLTFSLAIPLILLILAYFRKQPQSSQSSPEVTSIGSNSTVG